MRAPSRPVQQSVKPRAQSPTDRRRDRRQFLWELGDSMTQAVAQACSREECVQTLRGAVEAVSQDASDPIRRLLLGRCAAELLVRLGKGCRTGILSVPQMPDDTAGDNRGQIHFVGETTTVLFTGQEIDGQSQPTSGQYGYEALLFERADETIDRHGREMTDDCTEF
jgi:hypothetical protein